ncbi:MAG: pentapeptide repeat-containing protein [Symploca sp. SIO1B1]|nr:pentapeptide repeat-containing protein [Symploca sp. SIO1B1]
MSEDTKKVSKNDLRNSQLGGGLVDADTVKAERIGGDIHNNVVLNQPSIYITDQCDSQTNNKKAQVSVTPEEKTTNKAKLEFVLTGSIDEFDKSKLKALTAHLRKLSRDVELTIIDTEEGSIKLILEGSPEGLKRLEELFKSGELTEVLGIPVEDVRFPSGETSSKDEEAKIAEKSRLVEEILTQGAEGRNLSGANLSGVDLSDANLSGADLRGANLSDANLSDADLSRAILSRANLSDAILSRANLSDAILGRANLSRANLSDANLSGANLSDANLINASLIDANLIDANLSDANLSGANLSRANLSDAYLRGVKISSATQLDDKWHLVWKILNQPTQYRDLSGVNLSRAILSDAYLIGANLNDANLSGANLSGADLSGADLSGADLSSAYLSDAYLIGANLSGADLSGAKINEATQLDDKWRLVWKILNQPTQYRDLRGADLRDAYLRDAYLRGADLRDAYLRGADLSRAYLIDANLIGADLIGADLRGADLSGVNLISANLIGTRFGGNLGTSEDMKLDLIRRGAIFEDSPGDRDRSSVPSLG